jgi:hypothetical protein
MRLESASSTDTVSVNFATASGSAAAVSDYASQLGTLTFDPGETSQDFTILVGNVHSRDELIGKLRRANREPGSGTRHRIAQRVGSKVCQITP